MDWDHCRTGRRSDLQVTAYAGFWHGTGSSVTHGVDGPVVTIVLTMVAVAVAVGTVYRAGGSGARAVWTGHFTAQANPPQPHQRTA